MIKSTIIRNLKEGDYVLIRGDSGDSSIFPNGKKEMKFVFDSIRADVVYYKEIDKPKSIAVFHTNITNIIEIQTRELNPEYFL